MGLRQWLIARIEEHRDGVQGELQDMRFQLDSMTRTAGLYQQRIATLEAANRDMATELRVLRRLNARMMRRVLDKLAPAPVVRPAAPDPLERLNEDGPGQDPEIDEAIARRAGPNEVTLRNNLLAFAARRLASKVPAKDVAREILEGAGWSADELRMMEDLS